jgi:hypothetical protein
MDRVMPQPKHAMEIFQLLNKSNCRQCRETTCLAFAGAVFRGQKELAECPVLSAEIVARYGSPSRAPSANDAELQRNLDRLKARVAGVDLPAAAARLGGRFEAGRLILRMLGKEVGLDASGQMVSDIHLHQWVSFPLLDYVLHGRGVAPGGSWVPFRELPGARDWQPLFGQRCEKPLKQIADRYPELFTDLIHLFNGQPVAAYEQADVSLVLHPLPLVPMLIAYWRPEDGIASSLHLFFDTSATQNLSLDSIFALGTGIVQMISKLVQRHGWRLPSA